MERNQNTLIWVETSKDVWEAKSIIGKIKVFKSICKGHAWMIRIASQPEGEYTTDKEAKKVASTIVQHRLAKFKNRTIPSVLFNIHKSQEI